MIDRAIVKALDVANRHPERITEPTTTNVLLLHILRELEKLNNGAART